MERHNVRLILALLLYSHTQEEQAKKLKTEACLLVLLYLLAI